MSSGLPGCFPALRLRAENTLNLGAISHGDEEKYSLKK